jgi:hypothetical protein
MEVLRLNRVFVSLRVNRRRWEHFAAAAHLMRRLHAIGLSGAGSLEIREKGQDWPHGSARALLLKLLTEKGLTSFRRNRHRTFSAYTWEQLRELVGVSNEQPANQVPTGIAGAKTSRGDSRLAQLGDQRSLSERVGETGVPCVQLSAQGSVLPRPRST